MTTQTLKFKKRYPKLRWSNCSIVLLCCIYLHANKNYLAGQWYFKQHYAYAYDKCPTDAQTMPLTLRI